LEELSSAGINEVSAVGDAAKISIAHGAQIFSCRLGGANCLKSPRLKV